MNTVELKDRKEQLKKEARELIESVRGAEEVRMLNEQELGRIDEIKAECKSIDEQIAQIERDLATKKQQNNNQQNNKKMEHKKFSLIQAIRNVVNGTENDEVTNAILNAGREDMRAAGLPSSGNIQIPSMESRTVSVAVEHDDVVGLDIFDVEKAIHNNSILSQLGCRMLSGLTNDVKLPVMGTATATWETENATTAATTPTISAITLKPNRLSVVVPVSKKLLAQDGAGVERAIREEIVYAIQSKFESTIFGTTAAVTGTNPGGLFAGTVSTEISDFDDITELEAAIDGVDYGEKKYVLSPSAKAAFRSMVKGANGVGMVYEHGEMDGTAAVCSAAVTADHLAYGDWRNLVVGTWGGLDITVDPFTLAASGEIRLVINFYCDAQLMRAGAIKVAKLA